MYYDIYLQDSLVVLNLRLRNEYKWKYKDMGKIKNKKSETTNEINELELLKKKYEEQKIEIEYLKKLSALVQKRNAEQQKKK